MNKRFRKTPNGDGITSLITATPSPPTIMFANAAANVSDPTEP